MADLPQENVAPYKNRSIAGGVNTRMFALDIRDDECVEAQNIDISTPGQRVKRTGYTLLATGITNGGILAISEFKPRGSVSTEMLAVAPGLTWNELWKFNAGSGGIWSFVQALVGHTTGTKTHIVVGQDFVGSQNHVKEAVICPEMEAFRYNYGYTGVSGNYVSHVATCYWGNATVQPNGKATEFAFSQAYGAGSGDNEGRVYFSDIVSFTSTGFGPVSDQSTHIVSMGGGRRQNVVAIRGFRNEEVVVFLSDRIEEIVVTSDGFNEITDLTIQVSTRNWSRKIIDDTIGCCSQRSVAKVTEDILFADQYGNIRSLMRTALDASQGTRSLPISEGIDSYIKRINKAALNTIAGYAYDRWYVLGLPLDSATSPSHLFRFDTVLKAWEGPFPGFNVTEFAVATFDAAGAPDALKNPNLYLANSVTGHVYRMFTGESDLGAPIEYRETGKRIDYGALDLMKSWIRFELIAVGTADEDVLVEANIGSGFVQIGTINVLGDAPTLPHGFPLTLGGTGVVLGKLSLEGLDRSRDIQMRLTCSSAENTIKIMGYHIYAHVENFEYQAPDNATQLLGGP
jgi:hypothetical protein